MKLLIISLSVNGAMGDFLRQTIKSLRNINEVKIDLLTNTGTGIQSDWNLNVFELPFDRNNIRTFINPISYFKMFKFILKKKHHKVLFLSNHPVNLILFKVLKAKNIFYYLHDHEPHSGVAGLDLYFSRSQLHYIYKSKFHLITSSHFMKSEVIRNYKLAAERLSVLYLGLLENFCFPTTSVVDEDIDVLFFGRLEYYKGLDVLIESQKFLPKNLSFVLVSKGNLLETFGIDKLPENFCHYNEYMPDRDLVNILKRSKIVVMPYRDATGTQVIQTAFYYSKPVIATNVGCLPEYIDDQLNGLIIEKENAFALAEAINLLIDNSDFRRRLGTTARDKVDDVFSNTVYANNLYNILTLSN